MATRQLFREVRGATSDFIGAMEDRTPIAYCIAAKVSVGRRGVN
jgi:hypothetical protein